MPGFRGFRSLALGCLLFAAAVPVTSCAARDPGASSPSPRPSTSAHRTAAAAAAAFVPESRAVTTTPSDVVGPPAFPPESDRDSAWYIVGGQRHGVSFFPRVHHPEVQYEAGDTLTFDRFHTADVMYEWLRRWAERYPDLVDLYEVGRSYEGRPILQVTLTNEKTGRAEDKPAAYFEGGRHAGEVTASESVLWLIQHLLTGYGHDPEITALLDHDAIYLRPENDPDGSTLYLSTAQALRSTVRPYDSDRDGLLDEDPAEDLDGDGVVYQMRWKPAPGSKIEATHVLDERDPSGRLLRRAKPGETAVYAVASEGVDNDGDGRINEDGIGGLDLHRNYPENWRPDTGLDRTGRGYTQNGAGAYPLSEPETRAVVVWLLEHPNVSVANSMDTRVPMHLRPPSTSFSREMFPEDLRYYERFDSMGVAITGYPWAGDVYDTYATRYEVSPWSGEPTQPEPLFGHGPDFGYFYFGAIWYGDELWNGGAMEDYNGDGKRDDLDALHWDDAENGGRGFKAWTPFQHPTLGTVEIGGFHPKFFSQNAPPAVLEQWIAKEARFNLALASQLPRFEIVDASVSREGSLAGTDGRTDGEADDSVTWNVDVTVRNAGALPTALRQAQLVKIVRPDRVRIRLPGDVASGDHPTAEVVTPGGRDHAQELGWLEPGQTATARLQIRTRGDVAPFTATIEALSTRGGRVEREITIGG